MTKAVLKNGIIEPLGPLPPNWTEGEKLSVEPESPPYEEEMSPEEFDRQFRIFSEACAAADPEDDDRLERALVEAKRLAKEQVRRQMGLL